MNLISYRPFNFLQDLKSIFDKAFEDSHFFKENLLSKQLFPLIDLKEESDRFCLVADIPGVNVKDVSIFARNNRLVIQGGISAEERTEKEGFLHNERFFGKFYREFPLPTNSNAEKISACIKNGVLEVSIPKASHDKDIQYIEVKDKS